MLDPKELAVNVMTGHLHIPDAQYELGRMLEAVIDERDEARKDLEESGNRITELENGLRDQLEVLASWMWIDLPYNVAEGVAASANKIRRLL